MNYLLKHKEQISNIKSKKSLLLHVCCGVCSVYPLLYLRKYFNITIYFSNSNIYPYEEYLKRLDALNKYLEHLNDNTIKLIVPSYNNDDFTKDLTPYKDLPEGQKRCYICYKKRMEEAYIFANNNHFDYFTTVMSIYKLRGFRVSVSACCMIPPYFCALLEKMLISISPLVL